MVQNWYRFHEPETSCKVAHIACYWWTIKTFRSFLSTYIIRCVLNVDKRLIQSVPWSLSLNLMFVTLWLGFVPGLFLRLGLAYTVFAFLWSIVGRTPRDPYYIYYIFCVPHRNRYWSWVKSKGHFLTFIEMGMQLLYKQSRTYLRSLQGKICLCFAP